MCAAEACSIIPPYSPLTTNRTSLPAWRPNCGNTSSIIRMTSRSGTRHSASKRRPPRWRLRASNSERLSWGVGDCALAQLQDDIAGLRSFLREWAQRFPEGNTHEPRYEHTYAAVCILY